VGGVMHHKKRLRTALMVRAKERVNVPYYNHRRNHYIYQCSMNYSYLKNMRPSEQRRMIKSKAKGRRSLNRAKQYYAEQGWLIDEVELGGKFRKSRDLFSSEQFPGFDLVGIKKGVVVFIQVKTNQPPTLKKYKEFAKLYAGVNVRIESYTWYDRIGALIHQFTNTETVYKIDLRRKVKKNV
jgi:hypothetical protein